MFPLHDFSLPGENIRRLPCHKGLRDAPLSAFQIVIGNLGTQTKLERFGEFLKGGDVFVDQDHLVGAGLAGEVDENGDKGIGGHFVFVNSPQVQLKVYGRIQWLTWRYIYRSWPILQTSVPCRHSSSLSYSRIERLLRNAPRGEYVGTSATSPYLSRIWKLVIRHNHIALSKVRLCRFPGREPQGTRIKRLAWLPFRHGAGL